MAALTQLTELPSCRRCHTTNHLTTTYWTNHQHSLCSNCIPTAVALFDRTFWPQPTPAPTNTEYDEVTLWAPA